MSYRRNKRWAIALGLASTVQIFTGLASSLEAGTIQWNQDLKQARRAATQLDKPILIKVSATWCGPCVKMKKETFADRQIVDHVSSCFVPVALDGDRDRALIRQLGVTAYPTTLVTSADFDVLKRITGFRSAQQLSQDLKQFCRHTSDGGPADGIDPFSGHCPVSPIDDGKFAIGDANVTTKYRGVQVRFRSESHREAFERDPARYWPIGDGRCVVSWLDDGKVQVGKMELGVLHGGALWFFATEEHRRRFNQSPDRYVRQLVQPDEPSR